MYKYRTRKRIHLPINPQFNSRTGILRSLVPPPPPLDSAWGDIAQDPELMELWKSGGRQRGKTIIKGPSGRPPKPPGPHSWDAKNNRWIKLVDPSMPETLKPYEGEEVEADPMAEFERRILDPTGVVMTAREFILMMDFERRNALQLNTLYWVPYDFRDYLELCKWLVKLEYISVIQHVEAKLYKARVILETSKEITKLTKPMTNPSLGAKIADAFRSGSAKSLRNDKKAYYLYLLAVLSKQLRNELRRLKDEIYEGGGGDKMPTNRQKQFDRGAFEFFVQTCPRYSVVEKMLPEHLKAGVGKWYWSEKGYQATSMLRTTAGTIISGLQAISEITAKTASTAGSVLGPIAVVLAPVGIVFEGKHLKNNAINKAAILKMIADLQNTGKVNDQSLRDQMIKDAALFKNPKAFAAKYGGKIDYKSIKEQMDELEKRLRAIQRGTKLRWFKIAGTVLGAGCAVAAIIVTGGVAAVVIMGVGIAASVATTAATVKDIYDWSVEYDERWKLAHTMLEAARVEAAYLKARLEGGKFIYSKKQVVPHPTINMLIGMGLFKEPADALFLHFSDAFIYQNVMLAMALGNSALADKGTD